MNFSRNQIGNEGARHLSIALRSNRVRKKILLIQPQTVAFDVLQTLTTLDLSRNQIGIEGVQHLSNAVESNEVSHIFV